jgi:hypothetical protein
MNERFSDPGITFEIWSPKNVTNDQRLEAVKMVESNIGKMYGYAQLLSLALKGLLKRVGIKIPNFIHLGITCNENAADAIKTYDFVELQHIDFKDIDTQDLYQLVYRCGKFELTHSK